MKKPASTSHVENPRFYKNLTLEQVERFETFYQWKTVIIPKYDDLSTFPSACFSFQNTLRNAGLEPLISSCAAYYPGLVRMFYSNLASDGKIPYTVINGCKLCLAYKVFSEVLEVLSSDSSLYDPEDEAWADYNKCRFYISLARISPKEVHARRARIHGGTFPERDNWSACIFNIDDRLFHYFLVYVLFPMSVTIAR